MKSIVSIFSFIMLAQWSIAQTTYIANNNPGAVGGVNVFTGATAFNDAQSAASDGDIIYVVPSGVNYGDMILTKELTVYGGGYNPDNQTGTKTQFASVQINASNTRISGIIFTDTVFDGYSVTIGTSVINTTIDRCKFKRFRAVASGIANIILQNCIILESTNSFGAQTFSMSTSVPNILFSNNIVFGTTSTINWAVLHGFNGAIIQNNLFIASTSGTTQRVFYSVTNSLIKNNIFYGRSPNPISTFTGNTVDSNLTFGSSDNDFLATGNTIGTNNIINQDPLFVDVPYGQSWTFTSDATFQAGSPAIGAGDDGSDIGLYGGGTPYDDNGAPLPIVQVITTPSMISQGSDLPVNIKGKGN